MFSKLHKKHYGCVSEINLKVNFLQKFQVEAEQADAWLASKEAFLTNEDLGVSFSLLTF